MEQLTFGEQVKIILSRKGMTIKELAETIEIQTGKKMSRQNLTQRLGRDNFQEQDMRLIAGILECPFHLNILSGEAGSVVLQKAPPAVVKQPAESVTTSGEGVDITIGELYDDADELGIEAVLGFEAALESEAAVPADMEDRRADMADRPASGSADMADRLASAAADQADRLAGAAADPADELTSTPASPTVQSAGKRLKAAFKKDTVQEEPEVGEINPYTGREYQSNSVRMHSSRIGYVQVYDRTSHKWIDMTEWAFLGYQERKKVLLGKKYEPPIYLD